MKHPSNFGTTLEGLGHSDGFPPLSAMESLHQVDIRGGAGGREVARANPATGQERHDLPPDSPSGKSEQELRWKGKLLINGLFDGEHYFRLAPIDRGTRLRHGEQFTGLLLPLLSGMFTATELGFNRMNEALKKQAEA